MSAPIAPTDLLRRARKFAGKAHGDQLYGEHARYVFHLSYVEWVLRRFGVTEEHLLAAGWLHDVLEDTTATDAEILDLFGPRMMMILSLLTDPPGATRVERKKLWAEQFVLARSEPRTAEIAADARLVKLADRIANVECALRDPRPDLVEMYRAEYGAFMEALETGSLPSDGRDVRMARALRDLFLERRP